MAANIGQMPLPPGWEAKYDPGQKRYFYINHTNHTTTWFDPRPSYYASQPQATLGTNFVPPQPRASPARTHPRPSPSPARSRKSDSAHPQQIEKSYGLDVNMMGENEEQEDTFTLDNKVKRELVRLYPTVGEDLIKDLMRGSDNNKHKVERQLKNMGYQPKSTPNASPARSPAVSPSRSPPKRASTPSREPAKPQMSEAAKQRLTKLFVERFSDLTETIISMALSACDYDEEKTLRLLRTMTDKKTDSSSAPHATSPAREQTPPRRSASPIRTYGSSRPSTSATRLDIDFGSINIPDIAASLTIPTFGESKRTTTTRTASPSVQARGPRAGAAGPRARKVVQPVKLQMRAGNYVSENRTIPQGADPTLCAGPDKDILIDEYVPTTGPQTENRRGPDRGNVSGACGSQGRDWGLQQGPEPEHYTGPDWTLVAGSCKQPQETCL